MAGDIQVSGHAAMPARRHRLSCLGLFVLTCVVHVVLWQSLSCFALVGSPSPPPKRSGHYQTPRHAVATAAPPTATAVVEVGDGSSQARRAGKRQSARRQGLGLMLRDGTRKSHSLAESTQFVTGFFKGLADRESFSQLLTSLYFVYKAMEDEFDATEDPNVKRLDFPQLRRLVAIEEDMEYFYGPRWRESIEASPAAVRYCEQIRKVASTSPALLIGHQYSRYMGDLFGGQMIANMATKSLGLREGTGTSFYHFRDIDNTKEFIEQWYGTLNQLDLTEAEKLAIVNEANVVFRLNVDVFEELEGSPFSATWSMLVSSLKEALGLL